MKSANERKSAKNLHEDQCQNQVPEVLHHPPKGCIL
jgi:hypothetical protein